jgi:hypothetical protein
MEGYQVRDAVALLSGGSKSRRRVVKKIENMPRRVGKYEEYPEFSKNDTTVTSAEWVEIAAKERGQRTFG